MRNVYSLQEHQAKAKVPTSLDESIGTIAKINRESVQKLNESAKGKPKKLIVQMEAIHVGRTKNYTYYTKEGLSAGIESWTTPRQKPVLTHHNDHNGEPIGRIIKAEFHDVTQSGKPGLVFTVEITDPEAIEKVLDGRYQTVSIGANTDKVTCNICGTDRTKEWCEHYPGEEYEGQTTHFIIGTTYGREVSYVNVPADEFAGNTSIEAVHDEDNSKASSQESVHMEIFQIAEGLFQHISQPDVNLFEHMNESQKSAMKSLMTFEERSNDMKTGQQDPNADPGAENPTVVEGEQTPTTPETPGATQTVEGEQEPEAPAATPAGTQEGAPAPETPAATPTTPVAESATVSEMQGTITKLVMEQQKMATRLSEAQAENDRLVKENAELHKAAHKTLAEKVVEMKRKLNKPDVVGIEYEEAVNAHVTRSKESLENTYSDLVAEMKAARPEPGSVANPGLNTDESDQGQENKQITIAEADSIISKMFKRK